MRSTLLLWFVMFREQCVVPVRGEGECVSTGSGGFGGPWYGIVDADAKPGEDAIGEEEAYGDLGGQWVFRRLK